MSNILDIILRAMGGVESEDTIAKTKAYRQCVRVDTVLNQGDAECEGASVKMGILHVAYGQYWKIMTDG